jgi:hypothetical protein
MTSFASDLRPPSADTRSDNSQHLTVVICPKAKLPAEVGLDARQDIESCSRWNGSSHCSQTCLPQIRFCAEGLQEFRERYEGKICASCGAPLMPSDWYETRLMGLAAAAGEEISSGGALPAEDNPICSSCFRGRMQ